ncbi:MAG TPA: glycerophosphodiester phosphodiesterase [Candidatus Kryptonia bacterium]|nr:glycerophosphodiester phosphodiesterase [Candidatus Kryptonia bacterium]
MSSRYFAPPRPRVFGHRGAAGLAPENTLPSFALALALGANYLELDVQGTRDGAIVVLHDPTLERTTDGEGPVCDLTLAEVDRLDAGHQFSIDGRHYPYRGQGIRVPTLSALLQRFPTTPLNIEIKQEEPAIVEDVVRLIAAAGRADEVLLAAEHDTIMTAIRATVGDRIATSFSTGEVVDFVARLNGEFGEYRPAGRALQIPPSYNGIELITTESVAAAHRYGLEIHAWTINDRAEVDQLLALGVDGIMSDLPGLARVAVDARSR